MHYNLFQEVPPNNLQPSAPPANLMYDMWQHQDSLRTTPRLNKQRKHAFTQKTLVIPEACTVCEKRIGFGRCAYKCKDCRGVCHSECRDRLPLPCILSLNTPTQRAMLVRNCFYVHIKMSENLSFDLHKLTKFYF